MSATRRAVPADLREREAAVNERARNVIVDAGAGTGKTTLLVGRVLQLIAPTDDRLPAMPIGRVAAITFTRKAAGELKLRVRERVLAELGEQGLSEVRRARLLAALAGLDTAAIGTIHSFADRLLRLRPVEAALSPEYEIVTDTAALERETFASLVLLAESRTLAARFSEARTRKLAEEAEQTVQEALRAGLLADSRTRGHHTDLGLDALVQAFIATRDLSAPLPKRAPANLTAFRAAAQGYLDAVAALRGDSPGLKALRRFAAALRRARRCDEPAAAYADVAPLHATLLGGQRATLRDTFAGEKAAFALFKTEHEREYDKSVFVAPMFAALAPWLATGLARLRPVVLELYAQLKRAQRAVDQADLLIVLRDLLRDDLTIRRELAGLFDHILVDEFQDTDPLQAEILIYLCERGTGAGTMADAELAPGRLTLVGDPKQSIYRFRRADVATYDRVRGLVAAGGALQATLSTNFRSHPQLIAWCNSQLEKVLGAPDDPSRLFDPESGQVFHQTLVAGRSGAHEPRVHVVPVLCEGKSKADKLRPLEAAALAAYLDHLVRRSGFELPDAAHATGRRPVRFGDIAVLAISTFSLALLFRELDARAIPYALRGGELFVKDPLQRQLILALRALADRHDGPAQAALLRPPFFALEVDDLVAHRADPDGAGAGAARVRAAMTLVDELRRERHRRLPGDTARALLERTALGRVVAKEPNGAQRLMWLRDLCAYLDQRALAEGLDYDGVTAELRDWIDHPVKLDPPLPVGADAVQVTTIHQAKGLEWPVVVWWDGRASFSGQTRGHAFQVGPNGEWAIELQHLSHHASADQDLAARSKSYDDQERRRLVYVAATRARELFVLPADGTLNAGHVCATLLEEPPEGTTTPLPPYAGDELPVWAKGGRTKMAAKLEPAARLWQQQQGAWGEALARASVARLVPRAVTQLAAERAVERAPDDTEEKVDPEAPRVSRFGPAFGLTVHRALQWLLSGLRPTPAAAVAAAALEHGLEAHHAEAIADVERAVAALRAEGLLDPTQTVRLEYPVACAEGEAALVKGVIDFVSADARSLAIVDFKTDAPPVGELAASHAAYLEQIATYAQMLAPVAAGRAVRRGLLFTAEGAVRWV